MWRPVLDVPTLGRYTQEEQARRAGGRQTEVAAVQPAHGELSSTPVTVISAVLAIALIITFLLLSYFFPKVMCKYCRISPNRLCKYW